MMDKYKYGPEDLEALLTEKEFNELYEEERSFVLQHMEDETEYSELRRILLSLDEDEGLNFSAPVMMKEDLITTHREFHKKPSFTIWLNTLFSGFSFSSLFRQPAFQIAGLASVVLLIWFVIPVDQKEEIVLNDHKVSEQSRYGSESPKSSELIENDENVVTPIDIQEEAGDNMEPISEEVSFPEKPTASSSEHPVDLQVAIKEDTESGVSLDESPNQDGMNYSTFSEEESFSNDVLVEAEEKVRENSEEDYASDFTELSQTSAVKAETVSPASMDEALVSSRSKTSPKKLKDSSKVLPSTSVDNALISLIYTTW